MPQERPKEMAKRPKKKKKLALLKTWDYSYIFPFKLLSSVTVLYATLKKKKKMEFVGQKAANGVGQCRKVKRDGEISHWVSVG